MSTTRIYHSTNSATFTVHSPSLGVDHILVTLSRAEASEIYIDFCNYLHTGGADYSLHHGNIFELVRSADETQLMSIVKLYPAVVYAYMQYLDLKYDGLEFRLV